MTAPRPDDESFIRRSFELASAARARGDHPFGALLVGPDGEVLAEAMNTVGTTGDRTGHAERNLMTDVSVRFGVDVLSASTMYTSTEPCAMCAASVYWVGVRRVVFGLAGSALAAMTADGPDDESLSLPCDTVFAAGGRPTEVVGPVLPDEAVEPHEGFWVDR